MEWSLSYISDLSLQFMPYRYDVHTIILDSLCVTLHSMPSLCCSSKNFFIKIIWSCYIVSYYARKCKIRIILHKSRSWKLLYILLVILRNKDHVRSSRILGEYDCKTTLDLARSHKNFFLILPYLTSKILQEKVSKTLWDLTR